MVARSARRCAAFDVGGFGRASSPDITPMYHAVRAFSPTGMIHAVARPARVSGGRRPLVGFYPKARRTGMSVSDAHDLFGFYGVESWSHCIESRCDSML
ncbi:hypothetical protein BAT00_004835 [Salmonella enterica subsp. enterica serovar Falkensee]|nr:hypothetical protein [Salmonella enterica subsp. enterica serovar Agona]EDT9767020.1 hypothetical protein [Salmonella enterica subsp. enterica serovar Falkensee]